MTTAHEECQVLVVEDDAGIREALAELLEDEGYQVRTASNGREALDLLCGAADPPHLILLDLMMPVMDGWQLLEELERRGDCPARVVVLSAVQGASRGITRRVAGFLAKPPRTSELLETVERYC